MRIEVRVKPNSKKPFIKKGEDLTWIVAVREPAIEGRANDAVLAAIAEEFGVSRRCVRLIHGEKGKKKLIEIVED
ncbi:hypothetical protein LEP1GSC050_0949 [Leptospira broomii serovar Hurstbridge str. 5399]|uniref:Uncharacterized protein n=1 Tax=Leptospira broomii serovar Hurstbridge str. 5399 TaxID=1049789 RepID=T0GJP9_9LEPT|nr:DUF167 domain-containing protein [Leptospira broomii]EQA47019.1 hypothetical protein LEP1GSC050_0949 [Leptospira broomii serovar Hurstbridge str. 5399]